MGILDSILKTVSDPGHGYREAERANRAGWEEAKGFLSPYAQRGGEIYPQLNEAFRNLLDPTALQSKWGAAYETSPLAKQALEQNLGQGLDAASSMGLMGSSAALGNIQKGAGNISALDRQQFLENMMRQYLSGIGLGENIYGTGANAAGALGSGAQRFGEGMAELGYQRKMAPWNLYNNFMSQVGTGLGGALGMR